MTGSRRWMALCLPLLLLPLGCREQAPEKPAALPTAVADNSSENGAEMSPASLYFPDDTGHLSKEQIELPAGPTELRISKLVEALIAGPQDPTGVLHTVLPPETKAGGVLVLDAVAYVDLRAENGGPPPAVGSMDEQMILYSLVDTIVFNTEGIERVVLLWNGNQRETFAGHFDTTRPLLPDPNLIAER